MPSFYVKPVKTSSIMIPTYVDKVRDEVNVNIHLDEYIEVGVDSTTAISKSTSTVKLSNVTHGDAPSVIVVTSEIEEELEDEPGVNSRVTDIMDDSPSLQYVGFLDVAAKVDDDDGQNDEFAFATEEDLREDDEYVVYNVIMISYEEETALNSEENEDQIRNIQHNSTSLEEKSSMDIIQQLRKENQSLVASNQENVKQIALLEDEVATKQSMVDQMTDYIDEFSASCKEMMQENAALSEQQDVLNATIQVLESNNKNLVGEVEQLKSSFQEIITMNESLQLRIDDVTAANNTFVKINSTSEDEIADLLDVLERMTKTLEDERVSYEDEIKELTALLDKEKDDKNAIVSLLQEKNIINLDLTERLQLSHAKNDGLEAEVKSLFSRIKDNLQHIAVLEDDVAAKKFMIDTKSKDVESLNLMCKKNASENADLKKQLKLSDAESDRIKKTVQDLESNVNNYFFEVENLSSSLEVADTQIQALQARVLEQETVNHKLNQVNKKRDKTITALLAAVTNLQAGETLDDNTVKMISKLSTQAKISWGEISTQEHY